MFDHRSRSLHHPSLVATASTSCRLGPRLKRTAVTMGAAAILFGPCQAMAAAITANYALQDGVGESIARFDGGLGTLESVELQFMVHEVWEARFQADPGATNVTGEVYISADSDLIANPDDVKRMVRLLRVG